MEIVVSEIDADKLIRTLYKGRRPAHVHTLICACGALADLRKDPDAWDGWRVLPTAKCPACLTKRQLVEWNLIPHQARVLFLELIENIGKAG
jgi:hypothetical protein